MQTPTANADQDIRLAGLEKQLAQLSAALLLSDCEERVEAAEGLLRSLATTGQAHAQQITDLLGQVNTLARGDRVAALESLVQKMDTDFGTAKAGLDQAIAELRRKVQDTSAVESIATRVARDILKEVLIQRVEVVVNTAPPVQLDRQHRLFPALLKRVGANVPVMLIGPAGSGKTTAAAAVAKALSIAFYTQSVGPQTSKADLLGYKDANGHYHPSPLFKAYTSGGGYLLDEIDAGNAGVLTVLNAALANGHMTFGDGELHERHKDFRPLAAANTYGTGANRQYVGRCQLDAATLDRFAAMEWGYDEDFEMFLALAENPNARDWVRWVQKVRRVVEEKKILHVVSPRASIFGARLLAVGLDRAEVEQEWVWKNLTPVQIRQIKEAP